MNVCRKARLLIAAAMALFTGAAQSTAKVFTVGDAAGWTILNSPNYTAWASGKNFRVGDTLLFKYNPQFHNVLEVKEADFKACKNSSPLIEHSSGDDSIIIKAIGSHYFICGVPGHCDSGQKLEILAATAASSSPSISPGMAPSNSLAAPPPSSRGFLLGAASVFVGSMVVTCASILMVF